MKIQSLAASQDLPLFYYRTTMEGHRLQSLLAYLPESFRHYAAIHMDTIAKVINHLLIFMGVCNFVLFWAAWSAAFLPTLGLNTPLVSFLLCSQNACLWVIFNNARIQGMQFLSPSEFMVGNSLGITIGATLLAMVVSHYYGNLANCKSKKDIVPEFICQSPSTLASIKSVAFWSGLVFWLEFCLALLIVMGKNELITRSNNYEDLSGNDPDENTRRYQQSQQSVMGRFAEALPQNTFVGNYTSVPEIRSTPSAESASSAATNATPLGNV